MERRRWIKGILTTLLLLVGIVWGMNWLDEWTGLPTHMTEHVPVLKGMVQWGDDLGSGINQTGQRAGLWLARATGLDEAKGRVQGYLYDQQQGAYRKFPWVKAVGTSVGKIVDTGKNTAGAVTGILLPDEAKLNERLRAKQDIHRLTRNLEAKEQQIHELQQQVQGIRGQIHHLEKTENPIKGMLPDGFNFMGVPPDKSASSRLAVLPAGVASTGTLVPLPVPFLKSSKLPNIIPSFGGTPDASIPSAGIVGGGAAGVNTPGQPINGHLNSAGQCICP